MVGDTLAKMQFELEISHEKKSEMINNDVNQLITVYVTFGVYTGLAGLLMVVLLWVLFTKCHLRWS